MAIAKTKGKLKAKAVSKVSSAKGRIVKRLWASVNHSPTQVLTFLNDISESNFNGKLLSQLVTPQSIAEGTPIVAHILVILSAQTFEQLLSKGHDLESKTVILIENVVIATQYSGIVLLDASQVKSYHFLFKPLDSKIILDLRGSDNDPIDVASTKVDIIPALLHAQPPSILNPVMTFAYTIPDTDKRTQIMVDIFDMIANQGRIESMSWFSGNNKRMIELSDWLDSKIGLLATSSLSKALNKVKISDSDEQFRELAETYNVSKFDINYAVEFIKRTRINHPHIDTKQMFSTSEHVG